MFEHIMNNIIRSYHIIETFELNLNIIIRKAERFTTYIVSLIVIILLIYVN